MKYSIIQIGSFQYNVEEGKEYTVERFDAAEGSKYTAARVLLAGDGDKMVVGKPVVDKGEVVLTIVKQDKGEKVVSKIYKAKSRYRRTRGLRKLTTTFKVESIKF